MCRSVRSILDCSRRPGASNSSGSRAATSSRCSKVWERPARSGSIVDPYAPPTLAPNVSLARECVHELLQPLVRVVKYRRPVATQQDVKIQVEQVAHASPEARGIIHHLLSQQPAPPCR